MVEIQSKEIIDKISEELKIQPSLQIPRGLGKDIQLVYNVNPERLIQVKAVNNSDAASVTIHSTHVKKNTFLVGIQLTTSKDVVSDSLITSVAAIPFGKAVTNIFRIRYEPTTAGQFNKSIFFPIPILLEKATSILLTHSAATASIDSSAAIFFYETDPQ